MFQVDVAIVFQAEMYPAADAYIPLIPEDFLVTYSDVIPGLRRFDTAGQLSITTKTVISTLASPMISPTYSVVLRRLQLAIPGKVPAPDAVFDYVMGDVYTTVVVELLAEPPQAQTTGSGAGNVPSPVSGWLDSQ
eukprot:gene30493-35511_t